MTNFIFNYALVSPGLQVYTGRAGPGYLSRNKNDAFLYTEAGAYATIERCHNFRHFKAIHIDNIGTRWNIDKTYIITAIVE